MSNHFGENKYSESDFLVEVIEDYKLENLTTDDEVVIKKGDVCKVRVVPGKINGTLETSYSFYKPEAETSDDYLGFLLKPDFDDIEGEGIICRK